MKAIFIFALLHLIIISFGQTNFRSGIQGSNSDDELGFDDLVQMDDGSYVCAGWSYLEDNDGFLIAKFNPQGQLITSKNITQAYIDADQDENGISVIKTSDGGVAVRVNLEDDGNIGLLKFDANLTLQWFKKLGSDADDYSVGNGLVQTADGGFLVGGSINEIEVAVIIKTNATGDIIWSKQYFDLANEPDNSKAIWDIAPTKDGNYLLLADFYSNDEDFDSTYLIKINRNGNVVWSKYMTADLIPASIITTTDGNFLISGYAYNNVSAQATLIKVNHDGNVLWSTINNNAFSSHDTYFYEVIEDKDGGYIAAGQLDSADADDNRYSFSFFLKVSSSGNLIWTKVLSNTNGNKEAALGLIHTNDEGFAAAGSLSSVGILSKFGADYSICNSISQYGSLSDFHVASVIKAVSEKNINTSSNNATFSVGSIGSGITLCSLLPLHLISFNASLQNKRVNLEWQTANEINTSHFIIQRSLDAIHYDSIGKVNAINSTNVSTYNYIDNSITKIASSKLYYRLKEVDKDGKFIASNTLLIELLTEGKNILIYPNPTKNVINILLSQYLGKNAYLNLYDMTGKLVFHQKLSGYLSQQYVFENISSGNYRLVILQDNKKVMSQTLQIQK